MLIQQIEIISLLKINPTFMSFLKANYSIWNSEKYQQLYSSHSDNISYSTLYFGQSLISFCTQTLTLGVCCFIVFKLLSLCFKKPSKTDCYLKRLLYNSIKERAYWWSLMISLFEADFLVLCYECLNQFSLPFFYAFENKLNLVVVVFVFFSLICYGLVGYSLLFNYESKTSCILIFTKSKFRESFWLEAFVILMIKMCKSFAHSALFELNENRFIFLATVDVLAICVLIGFKCNFTNKFNFITSMTYQIGICAINILLFLR